MPTRYRPPRLVRIPRFIRRSTTRPSALRRGFEAVVGDWTIARRRRCPWLSVDGTRWRQGTPSANLADQAKRLYGDRYAEFLDGVKAFAFFPLAVVRGRFAGTTSPVGALLSRSPAGSIKALASRWASRPTAATSVRARMRSKTTFSSSVSSAATPDPRQRSRRDTASRAWHTLTVTLHGRRCRRTGRANRVPLTRSRHPAVGRSGCGRKPTRRCCSTTSRSSRCSRDRGDYELAISA